MHKLALAVVLLSAFLFAQEFRATLQGTVQDPSQAVVADATLVLLNVNTGVERKAASDTAGHYLFQFVAPGTYSLTTRASGFKTEVRDGIQLSLSDNIRLDVQLAIGQAAETVTVTSSVTPLSDRLIVYGIRGP